jgi:hypothetical protein
MVDTATDWLQLARDAHSASTSYFDANIRSQVERDLRQFQSQHAGDSKYLSDAYKGRSRLFRPKTRTMIRKNEAIAAEAFFSTQDVVSVSAANDNDPRQQASAEIMQALLQHRLTKSIPWFLILNGAYQDAQSVGVAASYQYWEYDAKKRRDRPCIKLLPIENVRFDPGADWTNVVETSPYLIRLIPMYIKDVKARMKAADVKTGQPKWMYLDDATIRSAARKYGDSIRLTREGNRTDSKDQESPITDFSVVWAHEVFMEMDGQDYVYDMLGTEALLSEPRPIGERYWTGQRPIVIGYAVIETHKNYPSSLPKLTKDVQTEINEVANQRIDNVKFALNKRYFGKRGRQIDLRSLTRNIPGSVTLMQDVEDVKVVETKDVTASAYQEQDRLNLDFDDLAGSFSQSSVQSNRNLNETVGGMNILNTNASQVGGYQLRTFVETWVEPVLRQIVELEQAYETDDTILALAADKAQLLQKFGIDQVTDDLLLAELTINVNVGIGATNPTQQVTNFMLAMNSLKALLADHELQDYGLQVQEVVKELFGKLGYRDGGRFFEWNQQDPQIIALTAQVKELTQQLREKTAPELVAAQVAKIDAEIKKITSDAVKSGVESAYAAMQAGEVVAAIPAVAPVADQIMQGAGYQKPQPPGVDPNFPAPAAPDPGLAVNPVANKRTGVQFQPAGGNPMLPTNTNPMLPAPPASPNSGAMQGIETPRADGLR